MMPSRAAEPMPWSQGDPRWHQILLDDNNPRSRIGRVGCALTCIAEAGRRLAGRDIDPGALALLAKTEKTLIGQLVVWMTTGRLVGVDCRAVSPEWVRHSRDHGQLRVSTAHALRAGMAILHVDHSALEDEDGWQGDHYVLALRTEGDTVVCADPAGGKLIGLDALKLEGPSPHGPSRPYRVRGVLPVRRLP
jgi:hypothetical protein